MIALPAFAAGPAARPGLGAAALFQAKVRQDIRTVPVHDDALILLFEGSKELVAAGQEIRLSPGCGIAVRGGLQLDSGNVPDPRSGRYRALLLTFAPALVEEFARLHPLQSERPGEAWSWRRLEAHDLPHDAIAHAAAGLADPGLSLVLVRHRLFEVLLALSERGLRWPPPAAETPAQRLRALLSASPDKPWSSLDAARLLGVSEPTLRRWLSAEGTCFRDLLSEVRLTVGLTLLLTAPRRGIAEIALACGYESPSRFARRFRERFGTTPSELRDERKGSEAERQRSAEAFERA